MKKLFLSFLLSVSVLTNINAQTFQWAKRAGLWAFDLGYGIGCDNSGNVYIAGKYEMNANFGGTTITCAGNHDIYVAKYSPSGNLIWVKRAGGTYGDYAHALACDGSGNVYITGEIESSVSFGSGVTLTSNGDNDAFVAKYNTNGTLIWARKLGGGSKSDKGLGISVSGSNIYVTGKYVGQVNFAGTTLQGYGLADIFVAKYNSEGVFQWVKRAGGSGDDEGYAISNDPAGNVYVTGYFSGTSNFSGLSLTSKGGADIFIAKYNSAGDILWVKKAGGTAHDYGMGIKVNGSSQVFLTGGFRVKSTFGSYTLNASGGNADIFVAKYDANGNAAWARKAGGTLNDYGRAIALDASSNAFITGNYGFTATFSTTSITAADSTDVYFASYDTNGNFRWVLKSDGEPDASDPGRYIEMGLSIATDPSGNVLGSGTYRSKSSFGTTTLSAWNHTDIFITKIGQSSGRSMDVARSSISPPDSASFCRGGSVWLRTVADSNCTYQWLKDGAALEDAVGSAFKAEEPGRYTVQIIRGEDTLLAGPTIVKVTEKITASIKQSPSYFCSDSSAVLIASQGDGYIYQWKRNGKSIRGAKSASYTPVSNGDYQVRIIQGSCFDWSETFNVEFRSCAPKDTSAIISSVPDPKEDSMAVHIYPNPNSGLFTLELNLPGEYSIGHPVKVEVINSLGQIIYQQAISKNGNMLHQQVELDRSAPAGLYFLRVNMGEILDVQRLLLLEIARIAGLRH